jgi:hypothetical protein
MRITSPEQVPSMHQYQDTIEQPHTKCAAHHPIYDKQSSAVYIDDPDAVFIRYKK